MKRKKKIAIIIISSICLCLLLAITIWYKISVKIEDMNRMCYCACGYAKVEFKDGKIYMLQYPHDSVKVGDCIGIYHISGKTVDLLIDFENKQSRYNCELDHIGLRNIKFDAFTPVYHAHNDKSFKLYVYAALNKIGL